MMIRRGQRGDITDRQNVHAFTEDGSVSSSHCMLEGVHENSVDWQEERLWISLPENYCFP